jgi:hypothetical protein
MFETKRQRLWFVVSAIWVLGWTGAYVLGAFITPYGFKWDGWFMFALLPVFLVWGSVSVFTKLKAWIGQGH